MRVDGQPVGSTPLNADVFVDVGKHVVSVGSASATGDQSVLAEPGQTYTLTFDVPDDAAPPVSASASGNTSPQPTPPRTPVVQPAAERNENMTPVYWTLAVGGGLTAGSLVAALLFHGHASSKESDARSLSAQAGNCSSASRPECQQLASLMNDRNSANRRALVAVGSTAVFAAASGIMTYLVWPRSDKHPSAQPTAWALPGSSGIGVSGSF